MKSVDVIGAGFSGLTLAHHLQTLGLKVRVFEREKSVGGLIATLKTEMGSVETAANALVADAQVEALFRDLGLEFARRRPERKNRYIFWEKPSRWPLGMLTTARMLKQAMRFAAGSKSVLPKEKESVYDWACRVVNAEFEERLLAPALQGVFAGQTKDLSASLVVNGLLVKRQKSDLKGSVAPVGGMGELIHALRTRIEAEGGVIETGQKFSVPDRLSNPTVICTSAWSAAKILKESHPRVAGILESCVSLPLVSVTTFFEAHREDLQGFGCLFPTSQGFHSLGVLFNSCVFEGRSRHRSETWIMGGAHRPDIVEGSDAQILELVRHDRMRLSGREQNPLAVQVHRWPQALPNYSLAWEESLKKLEVNPPLYLHGNYLGALSLARINARSLSLAQSIKESYG